MRYCSVLIAASVLLQLVTVPQVRADQYELDLQEKMFDAISFIEEENQEYAGEYAGSEYSDNEYAANEYAPEASEYAAAPGNNEYQGSEYADGEYENAPPLTPFSKVDDSQLGSTIADQTKDGSVPQEVVDEVLRRMKEDPFFSLNGIGLTREQADLVRTAIVKHERESSTIYVAEPVADQPEYSGEYSGEYDGDVSDIQEQAADSESESAAPSPSPSASPSAGDDEYISDYTADDVSEYIESPEYIASQNGATVNPAGNVVIGEYVNGYIEYVEYSPAEYNEYVDYVQGPCADGPCDNGGSCTEVPAAMEGYTCSCPEGFGGINCEISFSSVKPCDADPCVNGGECIEWTNGQGYDCKCPDFFSGNNCEISPDPCAHNQCKHGSCHASNAHQYKCICDAGWEGAFCEQDIDGCNPNMCLNGATCQDMPPGSEQLYQCICPEGFTGPNCDQDIDECLTHPCQNGRCENTVGSFQCVCDSGWEGRSCEKKIDFCAHLPCMNGGSCTSLEDDFKCDCPAGFTEKDCSLDIDDCAGNPCHNGGTCRDLVNDFQCICREGFDGKDCSIERDLCDVNPCQNGGVCNNFRTHFTCTCPTNFHGDVCQDFHDLCRDEPCQNGGSCFQGLEGEPYTCSCLPSWGGVNCSEPRNPCDPNPCHNGGSCEHDGLEFKCHCGHGYYGSLCENSRDFCAVYPSPCVHGSCVNGDSDYSCQCESGWLGKNCSESTFQCAESTCQNGGVCTAQGADFTCECPHGFAGKDCSLKVEFKWFSDAWTECSATCGEGVQTRDVFCRDTAGNDVAEEECGHDKPKTEKACKNKDCPKNKKYSFSLGEWGPCSAHCDGTQTRQVTCQSDDGDVVDGDNVRLHCGSEVPETSRACNHDIKCYKPLSIGFASANSEMDRSLTSKPHGFSAINVLNDDRTSAWRPDRQNLPATLVLGRFSARTLRHLDVAWDEEHMPLEWKIEAVDFDGKHVELREVEHGVPTLLHEGDKSPVVFRAYALNKKLEAFAAREVHILVNKLPLGGSGVYKVEAYGDGDDPIVEKLAEEEKKPEAPVHTTPAPAPPTPIKADKESKKLRFRSKKLKF